MLSLPCAAEDWADQSAPAEHHRAGQAERQADDAGRPVPQAWLDDYSRGSADPWPWFTPKKKEG